MTPAQRDLILAALGLTPRNGRMPRWSHRNGYTAGVSGVHLWWEMVRLGLARESVSPWTGNITYHVTRAGAEAAGVLGRCRTEDVER